MQKRMETRFNPYEHEGIDSWKVVFLQTKEPRVMGHLYFPSKELATNVAETLKDNGYKGVMIYYHDKDLPF